jgi:hypothetical protein
MEIVTVGIYANFNEMLHCVKIFISYEKFILETRHKLQNTVLERRYFLNCFLGKRVKFDRFITSKGKKANNYPQKSS